MRDLQSESLQRLDFIRGKARQQASEDKTPAPFFFGSLNTFEDRVYQIAYNKEFARLVQDELNQDKG